MEFYKEIYIYIWRYVRFRVSRHEGHLSGGTCNECYILFRVNKNDLLMLEYDKGDP